MVWCYRCNCIWIYFMVEQEWIWLESSPVSDKVASFSSSKESDTCSACLRLIRMNCYPNRWDHITEFIVNYRLDRPVNPATPLPSIHPIQFDCDCSYWYWLLRARHVTQPMTEWTWMKELFNEQSVGITSNKLWQSSGNGSSVTPLRNDCLPWGWSPALLYRHLTVNGFCQSRDC